MKTSYKSQTNQAANSQTRYVLSCTLQRTQYSTDDCELTCLRTDRQNLCDLYRSSSECGNNTTPTLLNRKVCKHMANGTDGNILPDSCGYSPTMEGDSFHRIVLHTGNNVQVGKLNSVSTNEELCSFVRRWFNTLARYFTFILCSKMVTYAAAYTRGQEQ